MNSVVTEIPQKTLIAGQSDELLRLDRFLMRHKIIDSRERIKLIIERGGILLNDKLVTFPSKKIKKDDRIFIRHIFLPDYNEGQELRVIHQDDDIIVINKPAGLLTLPDEKSTVPSVFSQLKKILWRENIFPVHRLDKDTSGVMIFARNERAGKFLKEQFEKKQVKKIYLAVVRGKIKREQGIIKGIMHASGEFGESFFSVIEQYEFATLVEVYPRTGRTNQIRIQFSELGHPLVGEYKYLRPSRGPCIIFPRVALHSNSITFSHPADFKEVTFSAPVPDDVNSLVQFLKKYK